MLVLLFALIPASTLVGPVSAAYPDSVVINEVLVSPNNEAYNGTDWNGDGSFGTYNDMFVELYNPTDADVDISEWLLDDVADGGSPPCSIGYNTTLPAGGYMVFYRADTSLEFDFWNGDSIRVIDKSGNLIDETTFPGEDSDWDVSYARDTNGDWTKIAPPTPGIANDQPWPTADGGPGISHDIGTCFVENDYYHIGSYILEGRIVTMESEDSVIPYGSVLVTDGMIEAVWASGQQPVTVNLTDVPLIKTNGTIYPGLIDVHNHAKYNIIPLWDHGTDGWSNRYQWQAEASYQTAKDVGCSLYDPAVMTFAELRAIAGGNTALQGSSTSNTDTFDTILARNVELYNFGKDLIHTKVTELESDYIGQHIKDGNASGELDAWFLHLAEGTDASSRAEFNILTESNLLVGELVAIHGTALTQTEFSMMGDVGASLVWSPTSNLHLYGATADIATAKSEGVNIMIAPDWAPSGSKSSMHELKTADWWDENVMGDIFSDFEMVQTVTTNVVDAIGWAEHTGRIKAGLAADLVVIDTFVADPYRNLIDAIDPDIRLVVVGGLAVFGDVNTMQAMDDEIEIIQGLGFSKATDITYSGVPDATKSYAEIISEFEACNVGASVPIEYLFTFGDTRYFDILNNSLSFQKGRDIDLWGDYYDVELGEDGYRTQRDLIEIPDSDGDGVNDLNDDFPDDPTENMDSDGDGVGDNADVFPNDADETVDSDSDGVGDNGDAFPNDPAETLDSDGDGIGDNADPSPLPENPTGETCTFGQTKQVECNNCFCNSENVWSCEDNVCSSGVEAAGGTSKTLMYVILGSIGIGLLLTVGIGVGMNLGRRGGEDDGSEWAAEMAKADPIENDKAPKLPPMDAGPPQAAGGPALPATGLPEGWTMEQWEHYGEEYLRNQPL